MAKIVVGRVVDERKPQLFCQRAQFGAGETEQGTDKGEAARLHPGQPHRARTAEKSAQHRFGLIVEAVPGREPFVGPANAGERGTPDVPGPALERRALLHWGSDRQELETDRVGERRGGFGEPARPGQ